MANFILRIRPVMWIFWVAGLLAACSPYAPAQTSTLSPTPSYLPGDTTSFETVAQDAPLGDHPASPLYVVVTHPEQWDELREQLPAQALEAGKSAGESGDLVVLIAFAGVKGSSGYAISIERITSTAERWEVLVGETKPDEDQIVEPATTLPFHVVAISRGSLSQASSHVFVFLDSQGKILAQPEVLFP